MIETLFEWAYINHVAWSLAVLALGFIVWLVIALSNAENQRNALLTKQCADPCLQGRDRQEVPAHRALARALVGTRELRADPRQPGKISMAQARSSGLFL